MRVPKVRSLLLVGNEGPFPGNEEQGEEIGAIPRSVTPRAFPLKGKESISAACECCVQLPGRTTLPKKILERSNPFPSPKLFMSLQL